MFCYDDSQKAGNLRSPSLFLSTTLTYIQTFIYNCMCDEQHVFSIPSLLITSMLLNEIYRFGELPFDWLMMEC